MHPQRCLFSVYCNQAARKVRLSFLSGAFSQRRIQNISGSWCDTCCWGHCGNQKVLFNSGCEVQKDSQRQWCWACTVRMNGVARQRRKSCLHSILLFYKKMVRADVSISVYQVYKGAVFFTENKGLILEFVGDQKRIPTEGTQDQINVFWKVLLTSKESHVIKRRHIERGPVWYQKGLGGAEKHLEHRNRCLIEYRIEVWSWIFLPRLL